MNIVTWFPSPLTNNYFVQEKKAEEAEKNKEEEERRNFLLLPESQKVDCFVVSFQIHVVRKDKLLFGINLPLFVFHWVLSSSLYESLGVCLLGLSMPGIKSPLSIKGLNFLFLFLSNYQIIYHQAVKETCKMSIYIIYKHWIINIFFQQLFCSVVDLFSLEFWYFILQTEKYVVYIFQCN